MKAIVLKSYSSPRKVLKIKEVEKPVSQEDEVLVRVHAASVTFSNLILAQGSPFFIRMMAGGLLRPMIFGLDVSRRVEAVGGKVRKFKPGDEVWGHTGSSKSSRPIATWSRDTKKAMWSLRSDKTTTRRDK
jgi:NADPH:quinone reductase-like Zn-dependent oxidoreductase